MSTISGPSAASFTTRASGDAYSQLTSDEFMRIIFTELQQQDPLAPSDSKALLEQISTIRDIQSSVDLTNRLSSLVNQNEFSSAANLIGLKVTGLTDQAQEVTGKVKSVSRTNSGAVLTLENGTRIAMANLVSVVQETAP